MGAGPGDPGLLTLKGKRCLEEAEVVIYDYLVDPRILTYVHPKAELFYVGKRGGGEAVSQEEINSLLLDKASAGKVVVRLKGGDPFLFGRGGEEAEAIVAAGIEFEVVPGVTSAIAVPAYAGIPLTHRDYTSSVAIVTGHKEVWETSPRLNWDRLATACGTLVFLMGTRQLRQNMARLIHHDLSAETPVALVRWGTKAEQEVLEGTVGSIADLAEARCFEPPAVVVVGEVVRLRQRLKWFEKKPLFGRRVVITQAREQASVFAGLLEQQGAEAIYFPTVEIVPPDEEVPAYRAVHPQANAEELHAWLREGKIDLVTFTSSSAVRHFVAMLGDGEVLALLDQALVGCVGPVTANTASSFGLRVDIQPEEHTIPAFVEAIVEHFSNRQSPSTQR